jgi:hypothetical protein
MTSVALRALAEALEQWPRRSEVFGVASDDTHEVLVHGRMVDGVLVFSPPIQIDSCARTRA